ncbi:MAG: phosphotransferase family protein [Acidimicrobiia bacterium]|nr:phosphotransferase family protein [Acidimicrobiia bacterium]
MPSVDAPLLAAVCHRHFGDEVTIEDLRRLSGGASRETWAFTAATGDGPHHLVLRRDPGATIGSTDRTTEYRLLQAADAGGVAVPRVRFLLEAADGLGAGFVMDHIEGETIPRKILRDDAFASARARLTEQCADTAAAIHAIPLTSLPRLPRQDAASQIDQFQGVLDALGEPHPAFELGLRWLRARAPLLPATELGLVHGDFRNGNFIVDGDGLRSVLDWELAHLGDPVEDLGWLCVKSWRFGNVDLPAGGFGTVDELLAHYVAASGTPVSREHLQYWEVFGTLKWGVICEMQAFSHLQGLVRSVELAALGRRIAEMEWDLLDLIDPDPIAAPPEVDPVDPPTMHDRPTAVELLESVREYLEGDVMTGPGRVAFHARVASKVLASVERELRLGPGQYAAEQARLRDLTGVDTSVREQTVELAGRIRAGELDARTDQVFAAVRASVRSKLAVSNPDYVNSGR